MKDLNAKYSRSSQTWNNMGPCVYEEEKGKEGSEGRSELLVQNLA